MCSAGALESLGFTVTRLRFGEIENLYARFGTARPNLCFAGHTDVVPVGDAAAWSADAFAAAVIVGRLLDWPAANVLDVASRVSGFVASQPGATPRLPRDLLAS